MSRGHRIPIFIVKDLHRSCFFKIGFYFFPLQALYNKNPCFRKLLNNSEGEWV